MDRMRVLSNGGAIFVKSTGIKIWVDKETGKLKSDKYAWIASMPGFILSTDIEFIGQ